MNEELLFLIKKEIRNQYNSLAEFAREIGQKPQTFSNMLKRLGEGQDFNFHNLNKILNKLGYTFVIKKIKK